MCKAIGIFEKKVVKGKTFEPCCHYSKTPEQKSQLLEEMMAGYGDKTIGFVGDAGNDVSAMQTASVGFACIKNDNAASKLMESVANVVLKNKDKDGNPLPPDADDVVRVPVAIKKGRDVFWIVMINMIVALCCIIGTVGFALSGLVPLWLAVILHEGGAVIVVLLSLRAL